jgi:hypothetical protein
MQNSKVLGESEKEYNMRVDFIKMNNNSPNIDSYSKIWANMTFKGCKYNQEITNVINKLKAPKT